MKLSYAQNKKYFGILAGWFAVATAFFLPLSTSCSDFCFMAAPILCLCAGQLQDKWRLIWERRAVFIFLVLFALFVFGAFYSSAPTKYIFIYLFKFDKLLLGVLFVPIFINNKWASLAIHAFLLTTVVTLGAALIKKLGFIHTPGFGELLVFKDRIHTSFVLAMGSFFCGVLFFTQTPNKWRWFYLVLGIIITFTLFAMDGRSGYFIFFGLLLLLFWERWRWQGIIGYVLLSVFIVTTAYTFSSTFKLRIQEIGQDIQNYRQGTDINTSVGLRTSYVQHGLMIMKEHPFFGTGTGSAAGDYHAMHVQYMMDKKTVNPHNEYLNISIQLGIVGLAVFLIAFYLQWRDSSLLTQEMRYIARGLVIALTIGCLANSWLMDSMEGHFYIYFMAMAFATQISSRPLKL